MQTWEKVNKLRNIFHCQDVRSIDHCFFFVSMATVAVASKCNIRSINMARKQPMKGPIQYTMTCSQAVVPLQPKVWPVAMAGLKYMPVMLMPAKRHQ